MQVSSDTILFTETIQADMAVEKLTNKFLNSVKTESIVTSIDPYREIIAGFRGQLVNVYAEYDFKDPCTRLNLVTILPENTDYVKLFSRLRKLNETTAISLANSVTI